MPALALNYTYRYPFPSDIEARAQGTQLRLATWFAKHRGLRGPCKHVLAVQITLEEQETARDQENGERTQP